MDLFTTSDEGVLLFCPSIPMERSIYDTSRSLSQSFPCQTMKWCGPTVGRMSGCFVFYFLVSTLIHLVSDFMFYVLQDPVFAFRPH
ncbi:hypothetical protein BDV12DRAFT_96767 [Aspergillus spectabilis]